MIRSTVVVCALLLATAACGGSDSGDSGSDQDENSSPSASSSPQKKYANLTKAQARGALLKLADLPSGFSEDRSDDESSDVEFKSGDKACHDFVDAVYPHDDAPVKVDRTFLKDVTGPFVLSGISVRDLKEAEDQMTTAIASLDSCERFVDGSDNSRVTIAPVSFPKLGEQSIAFRLVNKGADFEFTATLVSVRLGGNIVSVGDASIAGGVGSEELERLARRAVSKVESVARN